MNGNVDEFIRAARRLCEDWNEMQEDRDISMFPSDAGKCARQLSRLIEDTFPDFDRKAFHGPVVVKDPKPLRYG